MHWDVVIAGGGPAGSSLSIRLARQGMRVAIIEREVFPREKLCGEFISPECFAHFEELGVKESMLAAGGTRIDETVFYTRKGASIVVPSPWFDPSGFALGLSRAAMDSVLLEKAREEGAEVYMGASVGSCSIGENGVASITVKNRSGASMMFEADLAVDATGRAAVLSKLASCVGHKPRPSEFVAFKAHISGAASSPNSCEIYSFDKGYGGLNFVEEGKANFCFIIRSREARQFKGDTDGLFRTLISQNARASKTLSAAAPLHDWIAVAIDRFGRKNLRPAMNVFSVGDAGAFIDPFTGSGMLLAMESAKILARAIAQSFPDADSVYRCYSDGHDKQFSNRLGISSLIRMAAYRPRVASTLIFLLSGSRTSRRLLARATRRGSAIDKPDR